MLQTGTNSRIADGVYHERGTEPCQTGGRAPGHCVRGGIGCPLHHPADFSRPATIADYANAVRYAATRETDTPG